MTSVRPAPRSSVSSRRRAPLFFSGKPTNVNSRVGKPDATRAAIAAPGREHLRDPADLDAARSPRGNRREIVHDEGDARVRLSVTKLLALGEAMTADVDRVLGGVVPEPDRHRVRLARRADRRDTSEPLALQIGNLSRREDAHRVNDPNGRGEYAVEVRTRSSISPTRSPCSAFVTRLISFHSRSARNSRHAASLVASSGQLRR